jgi:transposase
MLYAGLDLSRKRLDVCLLDEQGLRVAVTTAPPDADGLRGLADRFVAYDEPIYAALESMNGARFVHDTLEEQGWEVAVADAAKVKGLAPLAAKTDHIDAYVLAELARRDLVPAIWLPTPGVRDARERARFRLHLVRHRAALKARIHAGLIAYGYPCPVSDLFGARGRVLLGSFALPEAWRTSTTASLRLIEHLDSEIDACAAELRRLGAAHPYVPLLMTAPGIAWVLGYTIASEIGEIERFTSPKKLVGYTGLCPRVYQSGASDRRGPLAKNGPTYLRWALIEAAVHAARHPVYASHHEATKRRLGRQRGAKVARVEVARKLAEAIWYMLTRSEPFAPAGPAHPLVA